RLHGRKPHVVPIPTALLLFISGIAESLVANPPTTKSPLQVILANDDVDPEPARKKLGIDLTSLDEILRRCVGPQTVGGESKRNGE
ncbi:MAG: hypothetical protein JRD03_11335, partial [Deltaproteobacteria bacterium]|nr:hypothetical protein [Deltaproteobacteria bacterium]